MKKQLFRIFFIHILLSLTIIGCAAAGTDVLDQEIGQDDAVETQVETVDVVEEPSELESQPEIVEILESQPRFLISAEEDLQIPVTVLYEAFFEGETPVFVDVNTDLVATRSSPFTGGRPSIEATFLPGSILVPIVQTDDINQFINFAISPDGQQVLIDNDFLPDTITLTDQAGNTIDVSQPVRRVISAHGPSTALVYSVGAGDRLVSAAYLGARDPQGAAAMERIDPDFPEKDDGFFSQSEFNLEQAALLEPDIVIVSARSGWLDAVDELNIAVFLFEAETPTRLKEAVLLTGQLFGPHTEAQAEAWVAYYDMILSEIETKVSGIPFDQRPRVLFTGTEPLRVASGDMLQTNIIEFAGGVSVSVDLFGFWNDVNIEQVAVWDPEVIIVPPYGGASVEAITESPEWQILEAVKAGRVYRMPKLVAPWDTPAPDSVLGIIWMAQLLNPDLVELTCSVETAYFFNSFYNYAITEDEIASLCVFD